MEIKLFDRSWSHGTETTCLMQIRMTTWRRRGRRGRRPLRGRRRRRTREAILGRIRALPESSGTGLLLLHGFADAEGDIGLTSGGQIFPAGGPGLVTPPRLIFVVGVFALVNDSQAIRFLDERPLIALR